MVTVERQRNKNFGSIAFSAKSTKSSAVWFYSFRRTQTTSASRKSTSSKKQPYAQLEGVSARTSAARKHGNHNRLVEKLDQDYAWMVRKQVRNIRVRIIELKLTVVDGFQRKKRTIDDGVVKQTCFDLTV
ncbi:hypothetical protein PR202_ga12610 [Eleusine coracana subsp. coracana]|uniref:Uncharacterized protein n=1 Tax=Eleusine coracana subsp. coracana TaxID=191504 RepID=A0AAV5CCI1_ELECO|nr:hypothetical protein PR202_ga12610 [Eleusine coracana subsp. coracana]